MSELLNYEQIEEYLNGIPQYMEFSGIVRSKALLAELGEVEEGLRIIHVAGTNGKGSVCSYLNSILIEHGYRTGLFTSPHLVDIRERIQIDGQMISREDFVSCFHVVYKAEQQLRKKGIRLAYFDYFFGIAMCYYAREHVDYVVLETGLGGKLDSTNAIEHPVLSVITTISLEHTAILGDTVEAIAAEKAGIIKAGAPVVFSEKNPGASEVILRIADEKKSKAVGITADQYKIVKNEANYIDFSIHNEYYKNDCFLISSKAVYQVENCSIALTAAAVLEEENILKSDRDKLKKAVRKTFWPGRMEQVRESVYIDGAHNPEGIESFIESVRGICRGKTCTMLFSVVRDKNFETMIRMLCESELFEQFLITQVGGTRQLDEESMRKVFERYTDVPVLEFDTSGEAFAYGIDNRKDFFMCAGSLYLAGEIESEWNR